MTLDQNVHSERETSLHHHSVSPKSNTYLRKCRIVPKVILVPDNRPSIVKLFVEMGLAHDDNVIALISSIMRCFCAILVQVA
ncbi:hypothetical protein NPIL_81521 [Nephila pilipes]|uniref:Uncharacterized protein n=1 Tax=Nephila pilipes TaxID=299642 RepID=A0A8X6N3Z3_NEPPI|nr:hypothetical protein NPIL_81521 [Nephila pilipes]